MGYKDGGPMMEPAAISKAKAYKDYKASKNRDEAKVKKMGGGMMQRPMGGPMGGKDLWVINMEQNREQDLWVQRDLDNQLKKIIKL
jgi:hypothetical protein